MKTKTSRARFEEDRTSGLKYFEMLSSLLMNRLLKKRDNLNYTEAS